jgi:UMF1 family MFS transporter
MRQLVTTFRQIRLHRDAALFLLAYWLYIDGVNAVIRMSVDYGLALGLPSESLVKAILLVQFVGFPAALAFGKLGAWLGTKAGILIGLAAYIGVTVFGVLMESVWQFYTLAISIGLVQGGVQSLSRSLFLQLTPPDKAGEFFGFYNMLSKFAGFFGPMLMALFAHLTGNPRFALLSLLILFILGAWVLRSVDVARGRSAVAIGAG